MTFSERALLYAEQVISGEIKACQHVINSCRRFVNDLQREGFEYHYDSESAEKVCRFLEKLPHTKGRWAAKSETLKLSGWQIFIVCNMYGWLDDEGFRRFREAYIRVGRKNGKSLFGAGLGLNAFCNDDEFGSEVYSGATNEKQAFEVFTPARLICKRTPDLTAHFDIEINAKSLSILSNGSKFEPLIGKPGDGASPSFAIADEYHEHDSDDQVDTMITGMAAREQATMLYITTAGDNLSGPCKEKDDEVIKILNGEIEDETIFAIIYALDDGDEWDDEENLIKSNPNLDISISKKWLLDQLKKAQRSATKQNSFRTKHLNEWVGAMAAWMNMFNWKKQERNLDINDFVDYECHVAVDMAAVKDAVAIVIIFKKGDDYYLFSEFFAPQKASEINDKYKQFNLTGEMVLTPGARVDYSLVKDRIMAIGKRFNVLSFAFDDYQSEQMMQELMDAGLNIVNYGATVKNFSAPMKEFEALVLDDRMYHNGNGVMNWMMTNVVGRYDAKDNIFPNKANRNDERCKIDGPVAGIMAMGRWMENTDGGGVSLGFI